MSESLERTMEDFMISVITNTAGLSAIPVHHVDSTPTAENERFIVSAEIGEKSLEAAQAYACTITVELRSTDRDAAAVDGLFALMEFYVYPSNIPAAATAFIAANFSDFWIYPERMESSSDRAQNTRHRIRKYPFDVVFGTLRRADSTRVTADTTIYFADAA